jgi:hypothetical protein
MALTLQRGNPMATVLRTILIFEVILFGLAIPVMIFVSEVGGGAAAAFGGVGMVLAVVSAGLLRGPLGYGLAWFTQVVAIALGVLTPAMYAVGGMFTLLWVLTFVLGRRLEARSPAADADRV